jgi:uncharacterized membrane protein
VTSVVDAIVTFLCKFPPRVFSRGELVITPVVPTIALVVAAIVALAAVAWLYSRVRTLGTGDRVVLGALRAAAVLLVLGCLLRPGLVIASAVPQRNVFAVLFDDTRSMRLHDVGERSRLQQVQQAFDDTSAVMRRLGERFALRRFRFGAEASPLASARDLTGRGTRSDLATALGDVREDLNGLPLAGVVLVSDGADNGGSRYDDALLALRARRIPVYTVGIGRERFERDLAVERVQSPPRALAGANVLVEADVRVRGLGRDAAVVTAEADGRVVATDTLKSPTSGDLVHVRLRLPPLPAGVHRLTVRAVPMANEPVTENNEWQTSIEVRAGPDRVLYLEGEPRAEFAFLRRAVAGDSGVQVVGLMRSAEHKFLRLGVRDSLELLGGFPTSREELFAYRAIIIGSIEAAFFTADQMRMIAEFVSKRGGGLLVLGGRSSLSEGGFADTPLADVLPLTLTRGTPNEDGPATTVKVRPSRAGESHSALQLRNALAASRARWDSMPALTFVNSIGALRAGATVLLSGQVEGGRADVPVLSWQRYGRGMSAVFLAQDSWLWRMDASVAVEDVSHQTFWRQMVRWLVDDAPAPLEIVASPSHVAPGEPVTLRAHVADPLYTDINDANVSATVTTPSGTTMSVPLEWSLREDGSYSGKFTAADSGRYSIVANAKRGSDTSRTATTTLLVDDRGADVAQAEQRPALLQRIARETAGKYYALDDVSRLADDAMFTESGVTVRESKDLWDMPLVFILLATLLGAEWAYRRWRGLA